MTTPGSPQGSSPLRIGGIALLGLGVVAAIIGIGTLVGGSGGSTTATAPTAPTTTAAPAPTDGGAAPTTTPVVVPTFTPAPTPAPTGGAAPSGSAGGGGAGATGSGGGSGSGGSGSEGSGSGGSGSGASGGGGSVTKVAVRVYNNSTTTGLAARAAAQFRNAGWTVDAVTNYPTPSNADNLPTSTVFYRPGTGEQAAAEAMGRDFGLRVLPRNGLTVSEPGLAVVVTNDYRSRV